MTSTTFLIYKPLIRVSQPSPLGFKNENQGDSVTSQLFGLFSNNPSLSLSYIFHLISFRPFTNRISLILKSTAVRPLTTAIIPNLQMKKPKHSGQAFPLLTSNEAYEQMIFLSSLTLNALMTVVSNQPWWNKQLLNSWNTSEEWFKHGKYESEKTKEASKKDNQSKPVPPSPAAQTSCHSQVYHRGQGRISGKTL